MKKVAVLRNTYFTNLKREWKPRIRFSFMSSVEDSNKDRLTPFLLQQTIGTVVVPPLLERKLHSVLKGITVI